MTLKLRPQWIFLRPVDDKERKGKKLEVSSSWPGVAGSCHWDQRCIVKFTDPQLQKCYDRNFAEAAERSDELRQVGALIAAHDVFRLMEGPHSPRVHEAIEHLLLPTLRPVLRRWYQRSQADKDIAGVALRDHLSQLAGERLEIHAD